MTYYNVLYSAVPIILHFLIAFYTTRGLLCHRMQALPRFLWHSRSFDLRPAMAAGRCLMSDAAAQCRLQHPKERNPREPLYSNHLVGLRFRVGLDGHCG